MKSVQTNIDNCLLFTLSLSTKTKTARNRFFLCMVILVGSLFPGCLMSQQPSVSQGRIFLDNRTSRHMEIPAEADYQHKYDSHVVRHEPAEADYQDKYDPHVVRHEPAEADCQHKYDSHVVRHESAEADCQHKYDSHVVRHVPAEADCQ